MIVLLHHLFTLPGITFAYSISTGIRNSLELWRIPHPLEEKIYMMDLLWPEDTFQLLVFYKN